MADLDKAKMIEKDQHRLGVSTLQQQPLVWFCPSRWLLAYYDLQANIQTMSSHMCLADLNNEGENLMALIDFKEREHMPPSSAKDLANNSPLLTPKPTPYECRMRVYRGQQLIYNHFLEDVPSSLMTTSISLPAVTQTKGRLGANSKIDFPGSAPGKLTPNQQPLLTLTINDQIYLYHKLKPSHRLSLEDDECIMDSLNKSEVDVWDMVRQNKVDLEAMRELLSSLSQEFGNQSLTSHSNNFLALDSNEDRKQYLMAWKLKRFQNQQNQQHGCSLGGEQIMSMDTICCSTARLKYNSPITRSGDFGQTREKGSFLNNARWNRIIDIQKEGLLLGTEDRHLLIYELRSIRTRLECHYRLPAVPDHILVERRSPSSFDIKQDLRALTYKILISCRNCRIYSIDQLYLVNNKASPCELKELVALKSNVLDMCWTGMDESYSSGGVLQNRPQTSDRPTFVVACLDRRVYCFSSHSGRCKWIIELELPITCLICLPKIQIGPDEASLVGVGLQANRVDFYVASNGRIVDSIYFSRDDYPQAMTFGRFGREDNCLCLVTSFGRLLVFIMKRTAKFVHGQCLSSAASYASSALAHCSQILKQSSMENVHQTREAEASQNHEANQSKHLKLVETSSNLPSAFALSKSNSANVTDRMLDLMLQSEHQCDQVAAKSALDAHATRPRLQIPVKGREFVNQILEQSQKSRQTSQMFASQMMKLRDKVRQTILQQANSLAPDGAQEEGNRLMLAQVIGLGNIYRVQLALRLHMERFIERYGHLISGNVDDGKREERADRRKCHQWLLTSLVRSRHQGQLGGTNNNRRCQVRPFKFDLDNLVPDDKAKFGVRPVYETTIEFKMTILGQTTEPIEGDSVPVDVQVLARLLDLKSKAITIIQRPLFVASVNVPLVC